MAPVGKKLRKKKRRTREEFYLWDRITDIVSESREQLLGDSFSFEVCLEFIISDPLTLVLEDQVRNKLINFIGGDT